MKVDWFIRLQLVWYKQHIFYYYCSKGINHLDYIIIDYNYINTKVDKSRIINKLLYFCVWIEFAMCIWTIFLIMMLTTLWWTFFIDLVICTILWLVETNTSIFDFLTRNTRKINHLNTNISSNMSSHTISLL